MDNKVRVFISFKNTDASGQTEDSIIANDLYNELFGRGVQPFFSNVSLLTLGEGTYRKSINEALDSADVLLIVSTKAEYLTTRWIEYEWSSYHNDILSDDSRKFCQIVPYFSGAISRAEKPKELRDYQTFVIGSHTVKDVADFVQNCLNRIETQRKTSTTLAPVREEVSPLNPRWSLYTSDYNEEFARLKVQAESTAFADFSVLDKVFAVDSEESRWILDVGCAYNFVGNSRFTRYKNVRVLGIDMNDSCLEFAAKNSDGSIFTFRKLNVEGADFQMQLGGIMAELGIEKFDLVFMALVLHHLQWPIKVLRKLKKFIRVGGHIVIRGSDDGSVLAYNDNGLTQEILDKCHALYGFSDRQNGRKLFTQLVDAGYTDVMVESFMKDLSGKSDDERWQLYFERFSYRVNNFEKLYKTNPENIEKKQQYEWMKFAINALEDVFSSPNFWYCEYDYIAYAKI